ncbi:MAG: hypothetical protein Ct9H300mP11_02190 [Chloroflexota bacterium]|nr:MAG: hypothetical protein Ct9H300mP11_02190 [Chloroflexota bacterium]
MHPGLNRDQQELVNLAERLENRMPNAPRR